MSDLVQAALRSFAPEVPSLAEVAVIATRARTLARSTRRRRRPVMARPLVIAAAVALLLALLAAAAYAASLAISSASRPPAIAVSRLKPPVPPAPLDARLIATETPPPATPGTSVIDADDGIPAIVHSAVDRFTGRHVELKAEPAYPGGGGPDEVRTYTEPGTRNEYVVDKRGSLRGFTDFRLAQRYGVSAGSPLSDEKLIAMARAYVRLRFDATEAAWSATVQRREAGTGTDATKWIEVAVELRERVGGLPTSNYVSLHVAPDGRPFMVSRSHIPLTASEKPTTPRITKEQAMTALLAKAGRHGEYELESAKLGAFRDPTTGRNHLVWHLELKEIPPAPNVMIFGGMGGAVDAVTGEVVLVTHH